MGKSCLFLERWNRFSLAGIPGNRYYENESFFYDIFSYRHHGVDAGQPLYFLPHQEPDSGGTAFPMGGHCTILDGDLRIHGRKDPGAHRRRGCGSGGDQSRLPLAGGHGLPDLVVPAC